MYFIVPPGPPADARAAAETIDITTRCIHRLRRTLSNIRPIISFICKAYNGIMATSWAYVRILPCMQSKRIVGFQCITRVPLLIYCSGASRMYGRAPLICQRLFNPYYFLKCTSTTDFRSRGERTVKVRGRPRASSSFDLKQSSDERATTERRATECTVTIN